MIKAKAKISSLQTKKFDYRLSRHNNLWTNLGNFGHCDAATLGVRSTVDSYVCSTFFEYLTTIAGPWYFW